MNVFVDDDGVWHLEFLTPCEFLDENNFCKIYDRRPKICRDYSEDECTFQGDYSEKYTFKNIKEVEDFVKKKFGK